MSPSRSRRNVLFAEIGRVLGDGVKEATVAQSFDEAELLERVDNDVAFLAETVQMLDDRRPRR